MPFSRVPLLLALLHLIAAEQPSAPSPINAPLRDLPWGQLNILHTTDTHGWHAGHLQEPQYSADWGDYISFAHHLRKRADDDGSDLLLVDTGDRVEGNGLYDASDPKGKYTFGIFKHQHLDVITPGNHELYIGNTSKREYEEVVPDFKDAYVASNLDIYNPKSDKYEPLAKRYRVFETKNRRIRVLAFGFLFDFHGNANNTRVQPAAETVKEQWFQDAIRTKDIDLFLVAGHVPVRDSEEFTRIHKAIRSAQWDTPIAFFGGHTHIRDYVKYEKKAQGIESGRYMETLGFMSISGLSTRKEDAKVQARLEYQRLYIDNNLFSLHHHSGTTGSAFDTELGKNVSEAIHAARKKLDLDHTFGCAPQDYWLNRAPYPSNASLLSLLDERIIPDTFSEAVKDKRPSIVITNSGALRFDIFKGPFTIDSTFLVSPFTSGFRVLKDVEYGAASQVLRLLNNEGQILLSELMVLARQDEAIKLRDLAPPLPPVNQPTFQASHSAFGNDQQIPLASSPSAPSLPGYTTHDDLGSSGDDTVHARIQFYDVPNCVAAPIHFDAVEGAAATPEKVDLVYNEFIQDWVLLALRFLGKEYERSQTEAALGGATMTDVISQWVSEKWGCED